MAYQKWSSKEEKNLVYNFKKGIKIKVIAKNLGRKSGAIYSRLRKLASMKRL